MRILLIEDYERLRRSLAMTLKRSGYAVDHTGNGSDAFELLRDHSYDAMILDIMLPGVNGLALLKNLRDSGDDTPAMFLSAMSTVEDRVKGLRTGADDYLTKPFDIDELLARVEVLCRRRYRKAESVLKVLDLKVDTASKRVSRDGINIDLTAREFAAIEYLALRKGEVVSRLEIEEHIYDDLVSPMSNVVDATIYSLRRKLAVSPGSKDLIRTRRGQGYVLGDC